MTFASQLTLGLFDSTSLGGFGLPAARPHVAFRKETPEPVPVATVEPERIPAHSFRLTADRGLAATWKGRAADNLAAIRLLHELETADRAASPAEQALLARFTGFGASELANALFPLPGEPFRGGWEEMGTDLSALTSDVERAGLSRATQYAHFTPEFTARAIWTVLDEMGFRGGHVLEPGCGTGLFLATTPERAARMTAITAIEMDPITARIATKLFPDVWVRQEDFTRAKLTERYDLAIGNPPFSDRTVRAEDPVGRLGLSLHDYFIARAIDRLRPGGIAAFVTSRWTLDKTDRVAREHIAASADLLTAVRLPAGSMQADAGTEVVVDVLVFRKRGEGEGARPADWIEVQPVPDSEEDGQGALRVNAFFLAHPDQLLGCHGWGSGPFGPTYTCTGMVDDGLAARLLAALQRGTEDARFPVTEGVATSARPVLRVGSGTVADGAIIREGSFLVVDNVLHQIVDGVAVPVPVKSAGSKEGIFAKHAWIIRALIPVRDAVRAVLTAQETNELWGVPQARLAAQRRQKRLRRLIGPVHHVSQHSYPHLP